MRRLRVFYCLGGRLDDVAAVHPVEMSEADIHAELLSCIEEDGDFFGVIDDEETTLQVMYESEDDSYWIEIPYPEKGGSYGCSLSYSELFTVFETLPDRFAVTMIPNMKFQSWI